jgi:Pyruvate/2-oxoacid:ferredoxin oxidoreductase gamma subunit
LAVIDGVYYSIPNSSGYSPQTSDVEGIGSVVGMGNTLNEAIKDAKKIAETVKGYCIKIEIDALDEAASELKKLEGFGVKLF